MHPRYLDYKGGGKQPRGHVKKYTTRRKWNEVECLRVEIFFNGGMVV